MDSPGFLERAPTIEDQDEIAEDPATITDRCPGKAKLNALGGWCQGGELNSRPRAYESPALPLSYPGEISISEEAKSRTVGPGFKSLCCTTMGEPPARP